MPKTIDLVPHAEADCPECDGTGYRKKDGASCDCVTYCMPKGGSASEQQAPNAKTTTGDVLKTVLGGIASEVIDKYVFRNRAKK